MRSQRSIISFMKGLKHIFFDLDRTLWDFDRNSRETLRELHDKHLVGLKGGHERFIKVYERVNEQYWGMYRSGRMEREVLRYKRFEETLFRLGMRQPEDSLVRMLGDEYLEICPRKEGCLPKTHEVLTVLQQRYVLHIITNGFSETQAIKLQHSGLHKYFVEVITSDATGTKKPDPMIFEHALEISGAKKEESLMIGDDWRADIEGAMGVGIRAIHLTPEFHARSAEVKVITELVHLLDHL